MRRVRPLVVALMLMLAGCGVRPSEVTTMGDAPTGVARGVTLYFVDDAGRLTPQLRQTDQLGTIPEALALLLATQPGKDGLHTEISSTAGVTKVVVTSSPGLVQLRVPLADYEVTARGIDQIVCTALGVSVQRGEPRDTLVRVSFTLESAESGKDRSCPVIS